MSVQKIGFIDHYIDEWHANNYPQMIKDSSFGDLFELHMAWDEITLADRKPLSEWCNEMGVIKAMSLEQVVEECDCLVVLSPDNVERHEDLADLPLRSGKPVYIDKPFAPSLEVGKRMFAKAEKHGTPMMSSSALRFGSGIENAIRNEIGNEKVYFAATKGGGAFYNYAIHQIEMLVMTMGVGATRVMQVGNDKSQLMIVDYADGRRGCINLLGNNPFEISIRYGEDKSLTVGNMDDFFPRFIEAMLAFFNTRESSVPKEQTLEVTALLEAGTKAFEVPDQWVLVPGL